MPHIEHIKAVGIHTSQEAMDKIESIAPVFTYFEGGEIILDTRTFDQDDSILDDISEILRTPKQEILNGLVALYV